MNPASNVRASVALVLLPSLALSQPRDPLTIHPRDRIASAITDRSTVPLPDNVNPRALPEYDAGPVAPDFKMPGMVLTFARDAHQQAALNALTAAQQDPRSPHYHHWLTPAEFGAHFGLSQNDLNKVTAWLRDEGLTIDTVPASRSTITFSGTAREVERAFHTSIHYYRVDGKLHWANLEDPRIPQALSGVISGIQGLNDFRPRPLPEATAAASGALLQ